MKKFRKFVSRFFKLLPAIVREKFTRKFFFVDLNLLDDYEISLAVEYDEIVEAMSLVQTCYKQVELASNEALIRADYHNLLPSSYVFVAKDRKTGRIVGTISFIHRSCLGIPIEAQTEDPCQDCPFHRQSNRQYYSNRLTYRKNLPGNQSYCYHR